MPKVMLHPIIYTLLLLCGLLLLAQDHFQQQQVLFLLCSLLWVGPLLLLPKKWHPWLLMLMLFCFVCNFWWELLFFLPALIYAAAFTVPRSKLLLLPFSVAPLLFFWESRPLTGLLLILLSLLAILIAILQQQIQQLTTDHLIMVDEAFEKQVLLQQKNTELLNNREANLQLQVAEERNRIARDIHDNVGHLLSSSIIQLGAVKTLNQQPTLDPLLLQLEETIHQGMDNIRQSVHDLHQDSLSFKEGLDLLLSEFRFAPVILTGNPFKDLTKEETQTLLAVTKEALSNIMKHSNAKHVILTCETLPGFYRYQIKDDGRKHPRKSNTGIGLTAMRQRAAALNGQLHTNQDSNGFTVTIVLPRKNGGKSS